MSWLIFFCDMQWGEFRFVYKHVVRASIPEETWNTPFKLCPVPNFAFKFFRWTLKFWNPKHPAMAWIGKFYRRYAKEIPAWLGSIFTLIGATYPHKPIFITDGQTKKSTQKLFLPMWQPLSFLPILFCSLFVFWGNFTLWLISLKSARLQAICPSEGCAQTQSWGAQAPEPQSVPVSPNTQLCSPAGFTLPRLLSVSSIFSQNKPFLHRQGNFRVSDLW